MNLQPVIVGGGPAGMAAAIELARHGVRSTLLEEASRLGGVVYRGPLRDGVQLDYLGPRYSEALGKLHGEFQEQSGLIDVRLNHRVVGAEGTRALVVLDGAGGDHARRSATANQKRCGQAARAGDHRRYRAVVAVGGDAVACLGRQRRGRL